MKWTCFRLRPGKSDEVRRAGEAAIREFANLAEEGKLRGIAEQIRPPGAARFPSTTRRLSPCALEVAEGP